MYILERHKPIIFREFSVIISVGEKVVGSKHSYGNTFSKYMYNSVSYCLCFLIILFFDSNFNVFDMNPYNLLIYYF